MSLTADILDRCERGGFALARVASLESSDHVDELRAWLDAGRHGEMGYLERNADIRENPALLLDGARCAIMVADQYGVRGEDGSDSSTGPETQTGGAARGRIARYARGDDYHTVMKKRLHALCDVLRQEHPGEKFRVFVDTAPVQERELALRAGLGWIGKHTLLIHPRLGSWLLLGGIMTTLGLDATKPAERVDDHCGSCTRCIDACPTGCITPWSVDASRCVSYLTIEHRTPIDPRLHGEMGDWIFGCDVCQEVCPHNSPRAEGVGHAHGAYAPRRESFDLLEVLGWTDEDRRSAFTKSSMKRASLEMMKRNAWIAARNTPGIGGPSEPRA